MYKNECMDRFQNALMTIRKIASADREMAAAFELIFYHVEQVIKNSDKKDESFDILIKNRSIYERLNISLNDLMVIGMFMNCM